jgi:PhoH-like ATPase
MAAKKKIFVLDTNVILHDYNSIFKFAEHDVILPITVLEELDKFKRGDSLINFHAREFTRSIDELTDDDFFSKGVSLGNDMGRLFIETGKPYSEEFKTSFTENIPDHRILAIADYTKKNNKTKEVILVTKDINLRMKAKSLGILAEDYKRGQIQNLDQTISSSVISIDNIDNKYISQIYDNPEDGVLASELPFLEELKGNQYYILKSDSSSILCSYKPINKTINKVDKLNTYGIYPKNAEQAFAIDALMNPDISLVALSGKAGTGKTLLALAAALQQERSFDYIYLARPIVSLSNKDLGFLPGDVNDKISPYMQPLFDNLGFIKHKFNAHSKESQKIDDLQKVNKLLLAPLAYIRGRSISNSFFIIDEAQNLSPHEVKTIITRAGEGTKMVFTGDIEQIDSPYLDKKSNGLSHLFARMKNQDIFAHINLEKGERSYLAEIASDLL